MSDRDALTDRFSVLTRRTTDLAGRPIAAIAAVGLVVVWGAAGPAMHFSDTWQLLINTPTTIVTFIMVFLLQNAQDRDTATINAKLDELLLSMEEADDDVVGLDVKPQSEVDEKRERRLAESG